jgi:ElaB/YqjD/DUF883 family membrane-anchored ribosome-binding protein
MSTDPQPNLVPPQQPQPAPASGLQRYGKLLFVSGIVVVVASLSIAIWALHISHTQDVATLTTTTIDANGNVSSVTEDSAPNPSTSGSMQRVSLADPVAGFQDAMSMNLPAGWHFRGEVLRDVACSPGDAYPQFQATSADGSLSMVLMTPFFTSSMAPSFDMHSCGVVAPLTSTAEILTRYIVPALRPGVQTSAPEPVPGGEKFLQATNKSGNGMSMSGDIARVKLSYSKDGHPVEEYIVAFTTMIRYQGSPGGTSTTTVEIYTAPPGKLDALVHQSETDMQLTPNPQWQQRNMEIAQRSAAEAQQLGEQQRAAIQQNGEDAGAGGRAMLARTRSSIYATGQASMNNAARSEAARHAGAVGTADYVGDRPTQTYFFCNSNGGRTTNNNPNPPGPGWYACN